MLNTFANTLLLFLCSGTSDLTDYQEVHMQNYFYSNHLDTFLYITKYLGDKLLERGKTKFCRASKESLEYCVMTVIGKHF